MTVSDPERPFAPERADAVLGVIIHGWRHGLYGGTTCLSVLDGEAKGGRSQMSTPRNSRRALLAAVICLAAIGAPNGEAFGEQISVSWQVTDRTTGDDGNTATREGTATFANGEEARVVSKVVHNFGSGLGGTASVTTVYKFGDGSGFTLRSVGIWNSIIFRCAGIFGEGAGRFAGIAGGATGGGEPSGSGTGTVAWTGTYELLRK
jgi:hypothetical protein